MAAVSVKWSIGLNDVKLYTIDANILRSLLTIPQSFWFPYKLDVPSGLKITAGQRNMSGLTFGLPVDLTRHVNKQPEKIHFHTSAF